MFSKRYLLGIIGLMLLSLLPVNLKASSASATVFTLSPSHSSPAQGSEVHFMITAESLGDVYAYELNLTYDAVRLQFEQAVQLQEGPDYEMPPFLQDGQIRLSYTKLGNVAGVTGNASLYKLIFTAISQGPAEMRLDDVKLVNSSLQTESWTSGAAATVVISSAGSSPTPTPTSTPNPTTTPAPTPPGLVVTVHPEIRYDANSRIASATIASADWDQLLGEIQPENRNKKLRVQLTGNAEAAAYALELPSSAIDGSGNDKYLIEVATGMANVTLPSDMLQRSEKPGSQVSLKIGLADPSRIAPEIRSQIGQRPVIELALTADGQTLEWNNPDAPVTLQIPYTPSAKELEHPERITIWYLDGQGRVIAVPNGRYDPVTGTVKFTTTHFSSYAVVYVEKTFLDVGSQYWARNAIETLASKGIIAGVSEAEFLPGNRITRADFIALLVRTLELKSASAGSFSDVAAGAYYSGAVQTARAYGITEGMGGNRFNPESFITRQEMFALTERALTAVNRTLEHASDSELNAFKDTNLVSDYAVESIAKLVKAGLVHGNNGYIQPLQTASRAESATLIYQLYKFIHD